MGLASRKRKTMGQDERELLRKTKLNVESRYGDLDNLIGAESLLVPAFGKRVYRCRRFSSYAAYE